jgi:hypothetical protein
MGKFGKEPLVEIVGKTISSYGRYLMVNFLRIREQKGNSIAIS